MTDDETLRTIRAWAQDNSLPAEEQVKRLRIRMERLEARVGAECRKHREDHQAWTRIFGWLLAACLVLGGLTLWYTISYLGARVALKDVCKFVSREAVHLSDEAIGRGQPVDTLEGASMFAPNKTLCRRGRYRIWLSAVSHPLFSAPDTRTVCAAESIQRPNQRKRTAAQN